MDLTAPINKDNSCLINDVTATAKFEVHNVFKSKLMYTCKCTYMYWSKGAGCIGFAPA